jgi:hypothetical protein
MARRSYTGVFLEKSSNRYRAKHSKISLGTFATEEEAAKAKDLGALAVQKDTGRKVSTRQLSSGMLLYVFSNLQPAFIFQLHGATRMTCGKTGHRSSVTPRQSNPGYT